MILRAKSVVRIECGDAADLDLTEECPMKKDDEDGQFLRLCAWADQGAALK